MIATLEPRRLFAVTATLTVTECYAGHYEIHGTEAADVITVEVSQGAETFSLDGVTYAGVSYINVYGLGGDDVVNVFSTDGPGSIGASLSGDAGDDDLTLTFDGGIWGGEGDDRLHLTDSFRGSAYGEAGHDRIFVDGDSIWADISGGDGNDYIDAGGNNWGVFIDGGPGRDTIVGSRHDDQIRDDYGGSINGNGGLDDIRIF
jgi:hypothetical protein